MLQLPSSMVERFSGACREARAYSSTNDTPIYVIGPRVNLHHFDWFNFSLSPVLFNVCCNPNVIQLGPSTSPPLETMVLFAPILHDFADRLFLRRKATIVYDDFHDEWLRRAKSKFDWFLR